jgi:hypothetical protein
MQALRQRLFWLAFWVVGFAVAMTALLLHFKYQGAFAGLHRDRVLMAAREIDEIAEKDLSLGQDFWSIATLQEVLERRHAAEPLFTGIDVAGSDGRIAYSTDSARIGSALPAPWLEAFARSKGTASLEPSRQTAVVAAPIRNAFGQLAGFTVIRYGRTPEHEAVARFTRELLLKGSLVFAAGTLLLFGLLVAIERRLEGAFSRAAAAVRGGDGGRHPLEPQVERITGNIREAGERIAAVRATAEAAR